MAKLIDINDWVLSGGGGAGVSYFHKTDPGLLLKMDNRLVSEEEVEADMKTARIVYGLGLPTPEPGEVVFDGKRYGQVFRRIQGKISYARLVGEHPDQIPQLAHEFTEVVKLMHTTKGAGTGLRSIKEIYGDFILANPYRSQELKEKAIAFMNALPDGETCIHGDLHFGNLIKAGNERYIIDIASFGYGDPLFDQAMMFALHILGRANPKLHGELFHCTCEQFEEFWMCFLREYYGEGFSYEELKQRVLPFLAVRLLTMESESQRRLPPAAVEPIFDQFFGN